MQAALKTTAGRGTKRKPQPTVRERLAKKLLSGRARRATLGEVESAADESFQALKISRSQQQQMAGYTVPLVPAYALN